MITDESRKWILERTAEIMNDRPELRMPVRTAKERRAYARRMAEKSFARQREEEIDRLVCGSLLFRLPIDERMRTLYDGLVEGEFIDRETKLEHFCVVLGRYLHDSETPFKKIRWVENGQLYRYFAHSLYGKEALFYTRFFFVNKYGKEMKLPSSDLKRLSKTELENLENLIQNYLGSITKRC